MFDRFIPLIGEENLKKIKNTNILLIGIGGVGGFTLEALVRSGFQNITIIDGDTIDFFKAKSEKCGIPYQTLINLYLSDCKEQNRELELKWN